MTTETQQKEKFVLPFDDGGDERIEPAAQAIFYEDNPGYSGADWVASTNKDKYRRFAAAALWTTDPQ